MHSSALRALECIDTKEKWCAKRANNNNNNNKNNKNNNNKNPTETLQKPADNRIMGLLTQLSDVTPLYIENNTIFTQMLYTVV